MNLTPGRELDYLIVEHVMGWQQTGISENGYPIYDHQYTADMALICGYSSQHRQIPFFSQNINAAFQVVEKLIAEGLNDFELINYKDGTWGATFLEFFYPSKIGEAPAHAICLAALRAKGYLKN